MYLAVSVWCTFWHDLVFIYHADDTYNIPKVTDCTAALNEWVYPPNGDCTRLMSTQPWQLPELVRRFTQDVYMCVYIQPDVAMYGDYEVDNGYEQSTVTITCK